MVKDNLAIPIFCILVSSILKYMKHFLHTFFGVPLIIFVTTAAYSQSCSTLNIIHHSDIASTSNQMTMTMMHDEAGRDYLYVANKEAGLKIYDIANITSPTLVATVATSLLGTLEVMNLSQSGNYLYLALGNTFTNPQQGGMAIIDVTTPSTPVVTDYYIVPGSASGCGIVKTEGNYAYVGVMKSGLVVLDISDKNNIQFVSQFVPDINYPPVINPNPDLYNARGMEVKNSIVYLCFDAGGFRIINCTNKALPTETGHWCNPAMYTPLNHPKAYNNIVIDDTLAYIAVDYAGMEVLSIADTSNIKMLGWWNPYNSPNNNWFTSPVHANEIQYDGNCKHIFMSTGKSDMMVIDVSNPTLPDSCNFYGGVSNNLGTWGIGMYQEQIYLSYIVASIPFSSNWTGVKILTYTSCTPITPVNIEDENKMDTISVFPNPTENKLTITFPSNNDKQMDLKIFNAFGQQVMNRLISSNTTTLDVSGLTNGIYFIRIELSGQTIYTKKIIVNN
jgi:hypothetical protein